MLQFYRSLDVYVCASRDEGTPNPCLEAASCGVPVVTTRVGCMPEIIQDGVNGLLTERTPEDLAARIRMLRESPTLRSSLREQMLQAVPAWDWRVMARNYSAMFRRFL